MTGSEAITNGLTASGSGLSRIPASAGCISTSESLFHLGADLPPLTVESESLCNRDLAESRLFNGLMRLPRSHRTAEGFACISHGFGRHFIPQTAPPPSPKVIG